MLRYQMRDAAKSSGARKPPLCARRTGSSQTFATYLIALDVDMGRLAAVARVEAEAIGTNPEDSRH